MYHEPVNEKPVGKNKEIVQLIKGFFNRNSSKYTLTWEVEPLQFFKKFTSMERMLSLKLLTCTESGFALGSGNSWESVL